MQLAEEQGYSVNVQASLLRQVRSNIVGMIVPKYDNRYFSDIAEQFEAMARARRFFPVVTCTQRDPELEFEAAKEFISYQVECLVSTGATVPDRISAFCGVSGVQSINLDLAGTDAPSVISDNYAAARDLTALILDRCKADLGWSGPVRFVGGRLADQNTAARLKGFLAAQHKRSNSVADTHIMTSGYSAQSAAKVLKNFSPDGPSGLFVNSTISLKGVEQWHSKLETGADKVRYGCFDWDPFGSFLPVNIGMLEIAFDMIGKQPATMAPVLVPCTLRAF